MTDFPRTPAVRPPHPGPGLTKHFRGLPYSPGHLRPVLRARLVPGERLIGWGVAQQAPDPTVQFAAMALSFLPLVAPVMGILLGSSKTRLLILTDQRLLVLSARTRIGARVRPVVVSDLPLWDLQVQNVGGRDRYDVSHGDADRLRLVLPTRQGRGAERLRAGLLVLARAG